MLSPYQYSLITHDCVAKHDSNTIIKFADDTTVVGLITVNDETAYREVVRDFVDYRKKGSEHTPFPLTGL
jgi:hypothetical protein